MSRPRFQDVAEWVDWSLASFPFFVGFNLAVAALLVVSLNASNFFISIVTADAVLIGAGMLRRAWCALHAKLDEILRALPGAREALIRAEERDEREIGELRA